MALFKRRPAPTAEEQFVQRVGNLTLGTPGIARVEQVGPLSLEAFRADSQEPIRIELANLFLDLRDAPHAEVSATVTTFLRSLTSPPVVDDWDHARTHLRPVVKAVSWSLGMHADSRALEWPIAPQLVGAVAVDGESSVAFPIASTVAGWPISADEAWALACEQLATEGLPLTAAGQGLDGAFLIAGPDSLQSSWLALPAHLNRAPIDGDVLVIAPRRDDVLLLDASDEALVVRALEVAEDLFRNDSRPLSPAPYLVADDGIFPWHPPASHLAHLRAEHAHRLFALSEYAEQLAVLSPMLEAAGEDVYVAILGGRQTAAGRTETYAVWPEGSFTTLLPRADHVVFGHHDDTFTRVTWEDAFGVVGHLFEPELGLDPPRWRVQQWPEPAALTELRHRQVD